MYHELLSVYFFYLIKNHYYMLNLNVLMITIRTKKNVDVYTFNGSQTVDMLQSDVIFTR